MHWMASKHGARDLPPASASCLTTGLAFSSSRACLLRSCMHNCIHTHTQAHTHTHTGTHTHTHTHTRTHTHEHTHAQIHAQVPGYLNCIKLHFSAWHFFLFFPPMDAYLHKCKRARAHTHTHTHTVNYTNSHTNSLLTHAVCSSPEHA